MLRITDNYTLQTLCGAPHNVGNDDANGDICPYIVAEKSA